MNTQMLKQNINDENGQLLMFHTPDEDTEIQVKMLDETVWLTQDQMGKLFNTTRQNISCGSFSSFLPNISTVFIVATINIGHRKLDGGTAIFGLFVVPVDFVHDDIALFNIIAQ